MTSLCKNCVWIKAHQCHHKSNLQMIEGVEVLRRWGTINGVLNEKCGHTAKLWQGVRI